MIMITSGEFIVERLSSVSSADAKSRRLQIFKDERKVETVIR
jgi:hypothetical protein